MATRHTCPICGDAERLRFLCQAAGMDVFACSACGADHVWPMPTAADLKAYYDRREWFEGGEPGGYANYDAQTGWSLDLVRELLASFGETKNLSVLDVGCGYGTHLALAAECGWKCFGVEISDHARGVAQERLADRAFIVAGVDELIPHPFDLVLILDTLEHLPSPYPTLYHLFSIGAITPKTKLVIATPNAACDEARRNPAGWAYRHPPSHLVFYAPETLRWLLDRLRFTSVSIRGLSPAAPDVPPGDLARHAGLLAVAEGSDFTEFMRERYVPGTWSKIAEYEHVPRYALARTLARGKTVLDFGCGTGYGAALLAETAARVTGLDIDAGAVAWAGQTHRAANLEFVRADDLGASLPAKSFDLVTCFEMIEHVDHATQQAVIASFARLLRPEGLLLISTPNPATTALYGPNPYHIREMTAAELRELLAPHFAHVQILAQSVAPAVAFEADAAAPLSPLPGAAAAAHPLAFIGIASARPLPPPAPRVAFDRAQDYIAAYLAEVAALNRARAQAFGLFEQAADARRAAALAAAMRDAAQAERQAANAERDRALHERHQANLERHQANLERDEALRAAHAARTERDRAIHERNLAVGERDVLQHKLTSPRFLARQLVRATLARLRAMLRRLPG